MSRWRLRMMRSWVRVPVLSVHSTSMAPRFWIAFRRLTITWTRDIARAPLARLTVTIIGSISGVSPTATANANNSASSQSCLLRPLIRNTSGTITPIRRSIRPTKRFTPCSKAVLSCCATTWSASAPKKVRPPVRTITPVPKPLTTLAPMKQMLGMSNGSFTGSLQAWANFSAGMASPVRADWLMNRSLASISRRSAGTISPADKRTTSPGTRLSRGRSVKRPSSRSRRRTLAQVLTIERKRAAAAFERCSCTREVAMASTTIANTTAPARASPSRKDAMARLTSKAFSGFAARPQSSRQTVGLSSRVTVFGPCSRALAVASAMLRPAAEVPSCAQASAASRRPMSISAWVSSEVSACWRVPSRAEWLSRDKM
mmetsp:Transcript_37512/g.87391  ORF Transcript_37512/g.87391 Transcript_37512/m.87391 type:complete len:373 (-) Transcript_37512:1648-2766(-)